MTAGIRNTGRVRVPASWYLVQCILIAASVIAAVLLWDRIPERLAVHYEIAFHPDRYEEKNGGSVFILNIIQLFLLALLMGAERVVTSDAAALGRGMPEEKQRQFRYANGLLLYVLSLVLVAFFSYVQATILYGWPIRGAMWATIILLICIIAGVAALIVYVRKLGIHMQNGDVGEGAGKWIAGGLLLQPAGPCASRAEAAWYRVDGQFRQTAWLGDFSRDIGGAVHHRWDRGLGVK
ncbi:uncharacterized protein DUF1648 [Paenibacillus taihuensis]|uniref:Uncharacterized protein DUF1648 n=1 Tax=Paenibacillus taihuensis TaxID=1156355 RepID=A0A3D9SN84_9BACL|nr:uncharacterized protein DUF1648 [Paenibacillus taihuensis]